MDIIDFAAQVVFVSASGVLSPGPLFLANLIYGSKLGYYSGIKIASGHAIVEFPLIVLLALGIFGLFSFTFNSESTVIIGLIGGTAIIFFSLSQIIKIIKERNTYGVISSSNSNNSNNSNKNKINSSYFSKMSIKGRTLGGPLVIGLIFSALNPFFLVWWFTVGLKLISDSIFMFGILEGILILFTLHIWMDYAWLSVTAYLISKGKSIIKDKLYRYFLLSISIILASYGFYIIIDKIFL
ncbi:MAG: LysE family translocator [Thermoproteota archaeon]|nr:LysE family translocator [Thermoproteota archaeon]